MGLVIPSFVAVMISGRWSELVSGLWWVIVLCMAFVREVVLALKLKEVEKLGLMQIVFPIHMNMARTLVTVVL